jgi:hypothetical protein
MNLPVPICKVNVGAPDWSIVNRSSSSVILSRGPRYYAMPTTSLIALIIAGVEYRLE